MNNINNAALRDILQCRVIAMVGLSANWYRPSYFAASYLLHHGYQVIPVNPKYDELLGQKCYARLSDIPQSVAVEVVDLFQTSERVLPFAREAITIGAKVLWMQLGVMNEIAARLAGDAGLSVVMDRCMKIEHARLFGNLHVVGVNTGIVSAKRRTLA